MKKTFFLLTLFFLVKFIKSIAVGCANTNVLDTEVINCQDEPVCEYDCQEYLQDKIGECGGKVIYFKLPDPSIFSNVCILGNLGKDDDVNFAKRIIMSELFLKNISEVEKTDVFKEYEFRTKMRKLKSFCEKNGKDKALLRDLKDLQKETSSNERVRRMQIIENNGQLKLLEKLSFFINGKKCNCNAFEKYFQQTGELELLKAYKENVNQQCKNLYPLCFEKIQKFENESDQKFLMRTIGLKFYGTLLKEELLRNMNKENAMKNQIQKDSHAIIYFKELKDRCDKITEPWCNEYPDLNKIIDHLDVRIKDLETKQKSSYKSNYISNLWKSEVVNLLENKNLTLKELVRKVSRTDEECMNNFTEACYEKYKKRLQTSSLSNYKFQLICEWKFNYKDCLQRVCHENVIKNQYSVESVLFKANLNINEKEVCKDRQLYEQLDFFSTPNTMGLSPTFSLQYFKSNCQEKFSYKLFVSYPKSGYVFGDQYGDLIDVEMKSLNLMACKSPLQNLTDESNNSELLKCNIKTTTTLKYLYKQDNLFYYDIRSVLQGDDQCLNTYKNVLGRLGLGKVDEWKENEQKLKSKKLAVNDTLFIIRSKYSDLNLPYFLRKMPENVSKKYQEEVSVIENLKTNLRFYEAEDLKLLYYQMSSDEGKQIIYDEFKNLKVDYDKKFDTIKSLINDLNLKYAAYK